MGLKLLHSADWHLGAAFGSLPEEQRQRLNEYRKRIPQMVADLALREGCGAILLAGDLFDSQQPGRELTEAAMAALGGCGLPVFISPGNHDPYTAGSPWTQVWPANVRIFTGSWEAADPKGLPLRVYGAGYRSMDCPPLLEGFRAEGSDACVALVHGDPLNSASPCCPVTADQVRESGLDYLALGHIHKSGSFRAGDTLCAWPGCPMGGGWDETGPGQCLLVELDGGAQITPIRLPVPRFHDITLRITEDPAADLEAVLPAAPSEDLYRITLTGEGTPDTEALLRQFNGLCWLELRDRTVPPADPWAHAGEDSLQGIFTDLLREKLDSASEHQAAVIRQAAAISRALLDEREVPLP